MLYVNKILENIKMPHYINRKATQIEISHKWKSSEIKNFLFFQSIPIFIKVFPVTILINIRWFHTVFENRMEPPKKSIVKTWLRKIIIS